MNDLNHIGLIPDGSRRFARSRNLSNEYGHLIGFINLKKMIYTIFDLDITYFTIYGLSTKNLQRSQSELDKLFKIINTGLETLMDEIKIMNDKGINIRFFGHVNQLPFETRKNVNILESTTEKNNTYFLSILLNYDGQEEIVESVKKILKFVEYKNIDKETIKSFMWSHDQPPLDLVIRTGMGDGCRMSGFMTWDCSYAEFIFHEINFPEYSLQNLISDVNEYKNRQRRFGK